MLGSRRALKPACAVWQSFLDRLGHPPCRLPCHTQVAAPPTCPFGAHIRPCPRAGQTVVGRAGIVLADILASNGIIHITDGFVALPAGAAAAARSC